MARKRVWMDREDDGTRKMMDGKEAMVRERSDGDEWR